MAIKTTRKVNVPVGQRIAQGIEGAMKGIQFVDQLKNAQAKREQMQQQMQINEEKIAQIQEQKKSAAMLGLNKLNSQFMKSEDKTAAADLFWPRAQEMYRTLGIDMDKQTWMKQQKAGGEKLAQAYDNLADAASKFIGQGYRLSSEELELAYRQGREAILTEMNFTSDPEQQKVLRQKLNLWEKDAAGLRDKREDQRIKIQEASKDRTLAREELRQKEQASLTEDAKKVDENIASYDRALALLKDVTVGPVVGGDFVGGFRKALGDQRFELLEQSLNKIGLQEIAKFASEAGARSIDSDGERKFLQASLPGVNKTKETNQAILLIAKGQQLQKKMIAEGKSIDGTAKFYDPNTFDVVIAKPGEAPKGYKRVDSLYGAEPQPSPAPTPAPVKVEGLEIKF